MPRRPESSPPSEVCVGKSGGLILAVSPYHLATRELTAAVALTLADRAATLVPEPAEGHGRDDIRRAIERVPRLLRVLEAWRWSGPLWRSGVIAGEAETERPFAAMGPVSEQIAADPALVRLGGAKPPPAQSGDEADRWLDSFCSDLLRGGPDPSLSTLTTAAMDHFAAAHGLVSIRGSTDSIAQRAELKLMHKVFSIAIPVMSRAAGSRILELRASLRDELRELRSAISAAWNAKDTTGSAPSAKLAEAAAAYTEAFELWFARAARDDENAERTMRAFVSLTGAFLPADSALVCARAAIRGVARAAGKPTAPSERASAVKAPPVRVLVIRPMNVRPV